MRTLAGYVIRMKVLVISNMYPDRNGHWGVFVKKQVESLEKEGVEIIKVVRTRKTIVSYLCFILKCFIHVLFKSYDIVHAHYGFHSGLIPAILRKKPLIVTYHGSDALHEPSRNRSYFFLQKFTVANCEHIIAVSEDVKNTLVSKLHANPDKISVISCGVDSSDFIPLDKKKVRRKLGVTEDAKIVLFAGNINVMKGVDVLYECARHMPGVLFVFVGNGVAKQKRHNCWFVGPRPYEEMPLWMNAADVFALPSRSEGTPVVLLEALSCGIPVISSCVGGCADLVRDRETGCLVKIPNAVMADKSLTEFTNSENSLLLDSVREVEEKIGYLLKDDVNRNSMGEKGRKEILDHYDIRKIAQEIKRIYEEMTSDLG